MKYFVLVFKTFFLISVSWYFFKEYYFLGKELLGIIGVGIISLITSYLCFVLSRDLIWRKIGLIIVDKKYNNGRCGTFYSGPGCPCCNNPHNYHRGEFAYYGPLTISRTFVQKFICKKF